MEGGMAMRGIEEKGRENRDVADESQEKEEAGGGRRVSTTGTRILF